MKRFFEGVEGVLVLEAVTGGVRVRAASRTMEELRVVKEGGSTCGTSLWKSSERRRCVKVLFACSSETGVSCGFCDATTGVRGDVGTGMRGGKLTLLEV